MAHYFCPYCGGVSDEPKNCEMDGCEGQGTPLQECNCSDPASHSAPVSDQNDDLNQDL